VYAAAGQKGRGGWTWYTGSASWSYRVALEGVLGFEKVGECLRIDPCIPTTWPGFTLDYRHGTASYAFDIRNPDGMSRGVGMITIDGTVAEDGNIPLLDDGRRHDVVVTLGTPVPAHLELATT
jgi:cyclic beta-1,2-glucan synthetase